MSIKYSIGYLGVIYLKQYSQIYTYLWIVNVKNILGFGDKLVDFTYESNL